VRLSQAWLIARHDMRMFRHKRGIIIGLVAFPVGVAIGFPALIAIIIQGAGGAPTSSYLPGLIDAFGFWFVIAAASLPTSIAAYGIVGEKIEKSLEPLLATPSTDGEILLGKTLSAFVPTMIAVWAGSALFQVLTDVISGPSLGYYFYPNWEMAVILFVLAPIACLYSVETSVIVSSRVTDVRSAQQYAGVIFIPLIFVYIVGEIGKFTLNTENLLIIAGALGALTLGLYFVATRAFQREEILTRWK
jgi:ABC-2 type transport system permease protein